MKKTNKHKMGPLGTPLGNPIKYFNSLKGKTKVEPKQNLKFGGLRKKNCGGDTGIPCPEGTAGDPPTTKPIGANVGVGGFNLGYSGNVGPAAITNNKLNAAYNDANTGFGLSGAYNFADKSGNAGVTHNNDGWGVSGGINSKDGVTGSVNYTGEIGKKKIPVKVGFTYNKKGGTVKMLKGGTHKMPSGKVMLNSAMKKRATIKRKK